MAKGLISNGKWLWPMISAVMLCGMVAEARTHVKPADADAHQKRCRAVLEQFPLTVRGPTGDLWTGLDTKIPDAATSLLRPNMIVSRSYALQSTESYAVSLLIVDCNDARDLQGHYPPRCYPAQGQKELSEQPRTWNLAGMKMPVRGMEYTFADGPGGGEQTVYNFFITPRVPGVFVSHPELNGAICPDMSDVYVSGEDYQRRYFGAAEFQIVSQGPLTDDQMDRALIDLLTPNEDVIRTLMNRESGGE